MTKKQHWPDPVYLTKDHAINMTLRDYFAARAMSAYLVRPNLPINVSDEELAFACYDMADAMLKAREQ